MLGNKDVHPASQTRDNQAAPIPNTFTELAKPLEPLWHYRGPLEPRWHYSGYARANLGTPLWRVHGRCMIPKRLYPTTDVGFWQQLFRRISYCQRAQARWYQRSVCSQIPPHIWRSGASRLRVHLLRALLRGASIPLRILSQSQASTGLSTRSTFFIIPVTYC